MAYDNTNSGALFKAKEQKTPNHPGYTGTINAGGVEYWLSGWVKEKDGQKYFSLSLKPKEAQAKPQEKSIHDLPNDLPF